MGVLLLSKPGRREIVQLADVVKRLLVNDAGVAGNVFAQSWASGDDWRTFAPAATTSPYPAVSVLNTGADVAQTPVIDPVKFIAIVSRYIPGTDIVDPELDAAYKEIIGRVDAFVSATIRYSRNVVTNGADASAAYEEVMKHLYAWASANALGAQGSNDTTAILSGRMTAVIHAYLMCKPAAVRRRDTRRHVIEAWIHARTAEPMATYTLASQRSNLQSFAAYFVYLASIATGDVTLRTWAKTKWKEVVDLIDANGYQSLELRRSTYAEHYHKFLAIPVTTMAVLAEQNGDENLWTYKGAAAGVSPDPAILRLCKQIALNMGSNYATKPICAFACDRFGNNVGAYTMNQYVVETPVTYGPGNFIGPASYETVFSNAAIAKYGLGASGQALGKLQAVYNQHIANGSAVVNDSFGRALIPGPLTDIALGGSFVKAALAAEPIASGTPLTVMAVSGSAGNIGHAVAGNHGGSFTVNAAGAFTVDVTGLSGMAPNDGDFRRSEIVLKSRNRDFLLSCFVETEPRSFPRLFTNESFDDGYLGWTIASATSGPSGGNASLAGIVIEGGRLRCNEPAFDAFFARNRKTKFLKAGVSYTLTIVIENYVSGFISFAWGPNASLLTGRETNNTLFSGNGTFSQTFVPSVDCFGGIASRGSDRIDMDVLSIGGGNE